MRIRYHCIISEPLIQQCEMDYLISWNCRHIAHAHIIHDAFAFAQAEGYSGTLLCTPQALVEDYDDNESNNR